MYEVSPEFMPEALEDGRLYRFKARNFSYGVWVAATGGFIGVREKFYSFYPFTEYHAQTGGNHGTVFAIEHYGEHCVPEGIPLVEHLSARCDICEQATEFEPDIPFRRTPGRQYHVDRTLDADHDAHGHTYRPVNRALLEWLVQFEEDDDYRAFLTKIIDPNLTADESYALVQDLKAKRRERIDP